MNSCEFRLPHLERVIAGAGTIERLPSELERYGCTRAVVVTGRTLGASPLVSRIAALLGGRCVFVFDRVRQHVPSDCVEGLAAAVQQSRADSLVSVGGGSPIDAAKAVMHARIRDTGADAIVHVAIPTTLSAGEFTDVAGVTDKTTRVKRPVFDVRIAPRTVIADPEATQYTPAWLWAASGIRALDHAIETLYSSRPHPISEPLATRAIEMLTASLPRSLNHPNSVNDPNGPNANDPNVNDPNVNDPNVNDPNVNDPNGPNDPNDPNDWLHRSSCQMAAWLAVFGVTNAGFGLSHVLGHQIGPRWDVPHGITSAIMLPHAMAVMADAVPHRFASIARGLGIGVDPAGAAASARACVERTRAWIAQFTLPSRLRDVAVPERELGDIADHVCDVLRDADVIGRPITRADVMALLAAAY